MSWESLEQIAAAWSLVGFAIPLLFMDLFMHLPDVMNGRQFALLCFILGPVAWVIGIIGFAFWLLGDKKQ